MMLSVENIPIKNLNNMFIYKWVKPFQTKISYFKNALLISSFCFPVDNQTFL